MLTIVRQLLAGFLIGGGAILPGVSGGVLAVVFGVYRPLMELFSHPFAAIRRYWKLFLPVGIGAAVGFVVFARLCGTLFTLYETETTCLFVGLILGTVPALIRGASAGTKESLPKNRRWISSWLPAACSFLFLLGLLLLLNNSTARQLTPSIPWYLFCGAVWGLSLIVPGLSSSSILLYMGLYQPMSEGIGALDFAVILPVLLGIVLTALALSRVVNALFLKHFRVLSFAVIGLVLASCVMIVPLSYTGFLQIALCIGLAAVGAGIAYLFDRGNAKRPAAL